MRKLNFSHFPWPCIFAFPQVRTSKFRKLIKIPKVVSPKKSKFKLVDRFPGGNALKLCIIAELSNFEADISDKQQPNALQHI